MKKVLIASDLYSFLKADKDFKEWKDISIFVAGSNDEALEIHRSERMNLIITQLEMPGMSTGEFCSLVRADPDLRKVSIIMVCANEAGAIEQGLRCRANAVLLRPVHPLVLMTKARQLVDVPERGSYRGVISASIEGEKDRFFPMSRNVSTAGMLIETDRRLAEGDRLSCSLLFPDSSKMIQVSAKVVRAIESSGPEAEYQYGLKFTDLNSEVERVLTEYVEKNPIE